MTALCDRPDLHSRSKSSSAQPSPIEVPDEGETIDYDDLVGGRRSRRAGRRVDQSGALRRSAETRCRVTPKRSAICSIVMPSA
jgi:hypothetical protein